MVWVIWSNIIFCHNEKNRPPYVSSKGYIQNAPLTLQIIVERAIFLFCACIVQLSGKKK